MMSYSLNVHVIEINSINQMVWIMDTGCNSYLCNCLQGLRSPHPNAERRRRPRVLESAMVAINLRRRRHIL